MKIEDKKVFPSTFNPRELGALRKLFFKLIYLFILGNFYKAVT